MVRDDSFYSAHMSCNLIDLVWSFCNDLEAILSRVSAVNPGGETSPLEKHLEDITNHIHLVKMI